MLLRCFVVKPPEGTALVGIELRYRRANRAERSAIFDSTNESIVGIVCCYRARTFPGLQNNCHAQ